MTSRIETSTFRLVAECLNQLRYLVREIIMIVKKIYVDILTDLHVLSALECEKLTLRIRSLHVHALCAPR
jgi:hypothetical protein